ncbi:uncharacterized protein LOC143471188 [Clavelina lepadiformis]|uniref:uncharacterized protein LOC143471188 n=1 Tax=Clavelina lepadiformis TaxID=159417 RepID=UPI004043782B
MTIPCETRERKCDVAQCEEAASVRYASCHHQVCIAHEDPTFEACVVCSAPQPLLEDPELLDSSSSELSEHDEDDPADVSLPGNDDDVNNAVEIDDVIEHQPPNVRVAIQSFIALTEDLQVGQPLDDTIDEERKDGARFPQQSPEEEEN